VKSVVGESIVVRFQFDHLATGEEIEDTSGCLAHIFEQASIRREWVKEMGKVTPAVLGLEEFAPLESYEPAGVSDLNRR